jgi:hypothetical protein
MKRKQHSFKEVWNLFFTKNFRFTC